MLCTLTTASQQLIGQLITTVHGSKCIVSEDTLELMLL